MAAYHASIRDLFDSVIFVEKLAETRALTGFSRIEPPLPLDTQQAGADLRLGHQRWLPAFRVHGEGIFLTLNRSRVEAWLSGGQTRLGVLEARFNSMMQELGRDPRVISPAFILAHTLAHLLIRQLSFECGYGTSSIRERVYCQHEGDAWMCGILLYTAAGDVDGTMGGLVSQGRPGRLELIVENALESAAWCSSDPLCSESDGQGTDSLNLAACHACVLLPETSCEEGNRLLDRVGVLEYGRGGSA